VKKNKALIMWGAVAVVAIAAAVFDFQWEKLQTEKKSQTTKVLQMESSQVAAFELTAASFSVNREGTPLMTNKVRFEKTPEGWWIKSPIDERANQDQVLGFLEGVIQERAPEVNLTDAEVDWSQFGLEKPLGTIQLFDQSNQSYRISVGARKNFQGDAYLRRGEEQRVLLGTSGWFTRIEKTLFDFRDRRILREASMNIKAVRIVEGKQDTRFVLQGATWVTPEKPDWKLDQVKVREILSGLVGDVVTEFKREGIASQSELKEFGLAPAALQIEVTIEGKEQPWKAELSKLESQNHLVRVSEPAMVAVVASSDVGKFFGLDIAKLRDLKSPFEFEKGKVAKVEVKHGDDFFRASKTGESWTIEEKSTDQADLKAELVSQLVEKVQELEAKEFRGAAEAQKAERVPTEIRLSNDKGETVLELVLGDLQKRRVGGPSTNLVLARSNLSDEVFTIELEKAQELGINAFLAKELRPAIKETPDTPAETGSP